MDSNIGSLQFWLRLDTLAECVQCALTEHSLVVTCNAAAALTGHECVQCALSEHSLVVTCDAAAALTGRECVQCALTEHSLVVSK